MATPKTARRKRQRVRYRLVVYTILALIFLLGFFVGRVTKPTPQPKVESEIVAPTHEFLTMAAMLEEPTTVLEVEETKFYFDCPLSEEIQDYIFTLCEEESIPASLVIAVIDKESRFHSDVVSGTGDYGLMQINQCNHGWLSETYGINNFLDPQQNILGGVKILASLYHSYEDPNRILMSYNMGESGATTAWKNGTYSTSYSRDVVSLWEEYEKEVQHGTQGN